MMKLLCFHTLFVAMLSIAGSTFRLDDLEKHPVESRVSIKSVLR